MVWFSGLLLILSRCLHCSHFFIWVSGDLGIAVHPSIAGSQIYPLFYLKTKQMKIAFSHIFTLLKNDECFTVSKYATVGSGLTETTLVIQLVSCFQVTSWKLEIHQARAPDQKFAPLICRTYNTTRV